VAGADANVLGPRTRTLDDAEVGTQAVHLQGVVIVPRFRQHQQVDAFRAVELGQQGVELHRRQRSNVDERRPTAIS
jgi:hypothetical protein